MCKLCLSPYFFLLQLDDKIRCGKRRIFSKFREIQYWESILLLYRSA